MAWHIEMFRTTVRTVATVLLWTAISFGAPHNGIQQPLGTEIIDNTTYFDENTLLMFVGNTGSFAYDKTALLGRNGGLYFPRLTNKTLMYAAGLWLGAKVNGEVRVSVAEYSAEYAPGPILNGTFQPDRAAFRVYKINRGDTRASNPDYDQWPFDQGAPAVKDHAGSDSLDAGGMRIPLMLGGQALWTVFNDADPAKHVNNAGSTQPLGVEVQLYAYANKTPCEDGQTIYLRYTIINKGGNTLDSTYISLWADPDLGDAFNDLVGCDTGLSLGYCYNSGPDAVYGDKPPTVGFTVLQGPIVPSVSGSAWDSRKRIWIPRHRNLPMTAFNAYINGTDPSNATQTYNYMRGRLPDGTTMINPFTGQPTTYMVSGDPVTGTGWYDSNPADQRIMVNAGPFAMAPGDTQEVVAALDVGAGHSEIVWADTIHAAHTAGRSNGSAFGLIMQSGATTGHDYRIRFRIGDNSVQYPWSLRDVTTGVDVITDLANQSGDDNYPIVDGLMVKVCDAHPGVKEFKLQSGNERFTWSGGSGDLQFEAYGGSVGWMSPAYLFGGQPQQGIPVTDLKNVLIKLATTTPSGNFDGADPNVSYAYRYGRRFCDPPAMLSFAPFIINSASCGYAYQDFKKSVPLSAWDMESDPPRRLAVGFLENNVAGGTVDGTWWPPIYSLASNVAATGPREWLWIFGTDYSETPNPAFQVDANTSPLPVMYFLTFARRNGAGFETGDDFIITRSINNTDADEFTFTSPPPSGDHPLPWGVCAPVNSTSSISELKRIAAYVRSDFMQGSCACASHGDPKMDGVFDVLDVVAIIERVLGGDVCAQEALCPVERCDFNADGHTDLVDIIAGIVYAFSGGPAPRNPCL